MTATCPTISPSAQQTKSSLAGATLTIFILAAICFTIHLGYGPLSGTEGHRAITAHQMFQDGNYILPKLYGSVYLTKPPLPYWLIGLCDRFLGSR